MQIQDPSEGQVTIPIFWYFAPVGAKLFTGVSAFSSGVWDRDKPLEAYQTGDQAPYEYPYYNGKNIWGYTGQCRIGTDLQFERGLSAADLAKPLQPVPTCCSTSGRYGLFIFDRTIAPPTPYRSGLRFGDRTVQPDDQAAAGYRLGDRTLQPDQRARPGIRLGDRTRPPDDVAAAGYVLGDRTLQPDTTARPGVRLGDRTLQPDDTAAAGYVLADRSVPYDTFFAAGMQLGDRTLQPDTTARPGLVFGDRTTTGSSPYMGCSNCPGGSANVWQVTIAGATGDFATFNGTWNLSVVAGCAWQYVSGSLSVSFSKGPAGLGSLIFAQGLVSASFNPFSGVTCLGPNTFGAPILMGVGTFPSGPTLTLIS